MRIYLRNDLNAPKDSTDGAKDILEGTVVWHSRGRVGEVIGVPYGFLSLVFTEHDLAVRSISLT